MEVASSFTPFTPLPDKGLDIVVGGATATASMLLAFVAASQGWNSHAKFGDLLAPFLHKVLFVRVRLEALSVLSLFNYF
jgi:hypothetical protein